MKAQELADQHQSKLFIVAVCIVLMLVLYWVATYLTTSSRTEWDNSVGEVMERDFRVALTSIQTRAKLKGRVSQVELENRWVQVNSQGQPLVLSAEGEPDCEAIWQQVMGMSVANAAYPMVAIRIRDATSQWRCRYTDRSGHYFDYAPAL